MRIFNRLTLIALVLMVSTPAAGAPLLFLPTQHFDDSDSEFFDLFLVNPLSGQIERTLPWRGASRAMDSMRERIFLASETELSVLDVATLEVLESTPLGFEPRSMIVDPVHQELYVAAVLGGEFAVFDLDTLELKRTFDFGTRVTAFTLDPGRGMIVVARFVDDQRAFAQFDRLTGEMIGSPYLLGNGLALKILMDPEHQRFLVADLFSLQVLSLGPDGPIVDFETKFPIFVEDIGLDPVARRLYVHSTNDLAAVNLDRLMIEEPTDASDIDVELLSVPNDSAMDLDPARNRVYLARRPQFIPVPPGAGSPPHPPVSGTMRIRILQGQPLELIDDIDTGKLGGAVGSGPFLAGTALPPTVAVPALTFAGFIMLLLAVTIPACLAFRSSRAA